MRARTGAVLALVCMLLAGCVRTVAGTPTGVASAPLDCARSTSDQVVACLRDSLSTFWTAKLHRAVQLRAVVDPSPAQVPADCRSALRLHTAFSCPTDDTVYLTAPFLREMRTTGPAGLAWVRIATTLGHEMGHIVQFAVHESMTGQRHTWAQSRFIEQQADCLAGVWSASVGIADAAFLKANATVLTIVDSAWERRSHGTTPQRLAAVRRGERARNPAACGLHLPG